jgi:hypothetical protein
MGIHATSVYTGKGTTTDEGQSHSEAIVTKLLGGVEYAEGRTLYADNFYSSIPLAEKLYEKKITYCGTLRSNRKGVPQTVVKKKLKKGEVYGEEKGNVKVIKWLDKRPVLMITTISSHDNNLVETGKKTRTGEPIKKPSCVVSYNKAKKGVDYSDQMAAYHSVLRKGLKWYRKLAFELIFGTAIVNAWIIYNSRPNQNRLSITDFRKNLAKSLARIEEVCSTPSTKRNAHTFVKPEGSGRKKRNMCRGCYNNLRKTMSSKDAAKKVRRVITFCQDCEGQPGYCLPCFNVCHKT